MILRTHKTVFCKFHLICISKTIKNLIKDHFSRLEHSDGFVTILNSWRTIYSHPQTDCFVISKFFSVARHVVRLKLGSEPGQQAFHVGWPIHPTKPKHYCIVWDEPLQALDSMLMNTKLNLCALITQVTFPHKTEPPWNWLTNSPTLEAASHQPKRTSTHG